MMKSLMRGSSDTLGHVCELWEQRQLSNIKEIKLLFDRFLSLCRYYVTP